MNTQTSLPSQTTQNDQRDPLRWLIPAALLLLLLAICCVGQVVIVLLSPRDQASDLNLLSKKIADYAPWDLDLQLPPIAAEAAAAEANERSTADVLATQSPTPLIAANVPTEDVIVIAPPANAPTNTPGVVQLTPEPTVTPRPMISGPTDTPVIGTVPPNTPVPALPSATPTERSTVSTQQPTPTATQVEQPTTIVSPTPTVQPTEVTPSATQRAATNTPRTATNTPTLPVSTLPPSNTPTVLVNTPTETQVVITNTPFVPTNTPRPPTNTPRPPTSTRTPSDTPTPSDSPTPSNTRAPTSTRTATATFTATATNTPTDTPTATSTDTPTATPTDTPTATFTATPSNTPTPTQTPGCIAQDGIFKMAKQRLGAATVTTGQAVTYQICIYNRSGNPQQIQLVTDSFPQQWTYISCNASDGAIACINDGNPGGEMVSWGKADNTAYTLPDGADLLLTVTGSYGAANPAWCNDPGNYTLFYAGGGTLGGTDRPCVAVN